MGFNKANYKRIREEYNSKYKRAEADAEARRAEAEAAVVGLREINAMISSVGLELMGVAIGSFGNAEEKIAQIRAKNEELIAMRTSLLQSNGYPADYLEIKYECKKCGDTGFVDCRMCECMKRDLVAAGFASSGLGNAIEKQTFENFSLDYYRQNAQNFAMMQSNFAQIKEYAEEFCPSSSGNLLLIGGTGLGKTHLSSALARRVIERGYDVKYVSAMDLISDFEMQRFGNSISAREGDDTADYYDCDLLIIDDLGTEMSNQFTVSCLYNIINVRINNAKATVISTNLSQNDLRQRYWDRITSRLFGEYRPLLFVGNDVRAQKLKKK